MFNWSLSRWQPPYNDNTRWEKYRLLFKYSILCAEFYYVKPFIPTCILTFIHSVICYTFNKQIYPRLADISNCLFLISFTFRFNITCLAVSLTKFAHEVS